MASKKLLCFLFVHIFASLPWKVLPTVAIVPSVSPVVQIKSVDRDVSTVRTTTSVERKNNAVITNASVVS